MSEITGMHPRLVVDGAADALAFYEKAFGASVQDRHTDDAGRIVHAMVTAGAARFAVRDAGYGDPAPSGGVVSVIMTLEVDDADAVADRMVAHGATVIYPISDHEYGDRGGRVADPWGHQWMITAPLP